jgi:predicted enzyme related to lactoylglutathione lyase
MTAALGTVIIATTRMGTLAEFYAAGLGTEAFEEFGPNHAGLKIGDVYFGFDEVEDAPPPGPVSVWFSVDDLDATFARFVDLGAGVRQEPTEKPWGDRIASVVDPDGNLVGLAQRR